MASRFRKSHEEGTAPQVYVVPMSISSSATTITGEQLPLIGEMPRNAASSPLERPTRRTLFESPPLAKDRPGPAVGILRDARPLETIDVAGVRSGYKGYSTNSKYTALGRGLYTYAGISTNPRERYNAMASDIDANVSSRIRR